MKKITKILLVSGTTLEMIGTIVIVSLIFKIEELNKELESNCETLKICDVIKKRKKSTIVDIQYCIAGLCCIILGVMLKVYAYYGE